MRYSRVWRCRFVDCLLLVAFLLQGYVSTPDESEKARLPTHEYLGDKSEVSADHTEAHLAARGLLRDFVSSRSPFWPTKELKSVDVNQEPKHGDTKNSQDDDHSSKRDNLVREESAETLIHEIDPKNASNCPISKLKTSAQVVRGWFSNLQKPKDGTNQNESESAQKRWFNSWLSPKSQTPSPIVKEDSVVEKRAEGNSAHWWPSIMSPNSQTSSSPTKGNTSAEKSTDGNSGGGLLSLSKYQTGSPTPKEDKPPAKRADITSGGGWFNFWSPKTPTSPAPAEETTIGKRGNTDSGVQEETPIGKRGDENSRGGWLGGLWSSPSTPAPPPITKPPEPTNSFGGWFSGGSGNTNTNEAPTAAAESKEKKQHGRVREFIKSVEHIVPKPIRRSIKSLPGVRPSRKVMKSGLDIVDKAVDSVADTDYVRNIREATKKSSKRVSLKAVNLADSVLELGTGTSDATLNMAATLQKEGARTLDSVSTAIPPAKPTVDYINSKMADGVANLQEHNDRFRKGGKGVLTSISDYANLKEVADGAPIVSETPAEKKKPDGNSWFKW